ncbi:MAG: site-specific integrase [Muribaculaceae bacterium]|nr:site-specific integrase [Muribaculaceae bacterium]
MTNIKNPNANTITPSNTTGLFLYMASIIRRLRQNGQLRTAETYQSALNSFRRFRNCKDLRLADIESNTMQDYQAWLRSNDLTQNTISFYLRILRATYNRAVDEDLISDRRPFRRVYTGIDKTFKRALPLTVIKKIYRLDLSDSPELDFARDMFIISFMLRGMSFIDMAYLLKSDLCGGYITYRRSKTGQQLNIQWTSKMAAILSKYPENRSPYLLPIIRRDDINPRYAYKNMGYNINHNLKRIAKLLNIPIPLTLYVARHSWASAAQSKGIPLPLISEGLGHDNQVTTQIYLASLDTSAIDQANSLILRDL